MDGRPRGREAEAEPPCGQVCGQKKREQRRKRDNVKVRLGGRWWQACSLHSLPIPILQEQLGHNKKLDNVCIFLQLIFGLLANESARCDPQY